MPQFTQRRESRRPAPTYVGPNSLTAVLQAFERVGEFRAIFFLGVITILHLRSLLVTA